MHKYFVAKFRAKPLDERPVFELETVSPISQGQWDNSIAVCCCVCF